MNKTTEKGRAIGIFDSGYGGLSVWKDIVRLLPEYDYIYLGDNARAPYGNKSYETVYQYTLQGVAKLFERDCELVIVACNTASAKALRTIQQRDLPTYGSSKRVLGVIRPTTESIDNFTTSGEIGIFATWGTVRSQSYLIEIQKFFPHIKVYQEACPMWVALVENNELENSAAEYFVERHVQNLLKHSPRIDCIVLACTHYPLLLPLIQKAVPKHIRILNQGPLVAQSLKRYLTKHTSLEKTLSQKGTRFFWSTEKAQLFSDMASIFLGENIRAEQVVLEEAPSQR